MVREQMKMYPTKRNTGSSHYIDICLNKYFSIHFINITSIIPKPLDTIFNNIRNLRLNPILGGMNPTEIQLMTLD